MEIKEYQELSKELISLIDKKHNFQHDVDTTLIHIMEELGEVAREVYNKKSGRSDYDRKNLAEEIADCIFLLMQLANNFDFDMEKELINKYEILKKRYEKI